MHECTPDKGKPIYDRDGRPCPAASRDSYPLFGVCRTDGAPIICADGTADWTDDQRVFDLYPPEEPRLTTKPGSIELFCSACDGRIINLELWERHLQRHAARLSTR